jgi:tRNA pseudouridine38-40 synthase
MIKIQYDGTHYKGWQRLIDQPNTIQQTIEKVLSDYFSEKITICGSGRTDSGVHAKCQVADFFCSFPIDQSIFITEINQKLPDDIQIYFIQSVAKHFHSRKACISKAYSYQIALGDKCDVFSRKYTYFTSDAPIMCPSSSLSMANMKKAASYLIGRHDFSAFTSDKSEDKNHIREIYQINFLQRITPSGTRILTIEFIGNGFLYNMVRILAGTILYAGLGRIQPTSIPDILKAGERVNAGPTLPANGLCLESVTY